MMDDRAVTVYFLALLITVTSGTYKHLALSNVEQYELPELPFR